MKSKSFVHDGIEVILTGRIASRGVKGRRGNKDIKDELVEITPKDNEIGSWKKFVREKELYILSDGEQS